MKQKINLLFIFLFITVSIFTFIACDKTYDSGDYEENVRTVKDADGNVYNTVKIGNQIWTVENLKTTKYNNGKAIPNITDNDEWVSLTKGAWCNYENLDGNSEIYGRLYNWYAVNTGNLAPKGWHVPSNDDWTILEEYLIENGYNFDGTKEGNKIAKSLCAKTGWYLSDIVGTPGDAPESNNTSGFSALPGGYRTKEGGAFFLAEDIGMWWSSTAYDDNNAYSRYLFCYLKSLTWNINSNNSKENGFSVRLVKD